MAEDTTVYLGDLDPSYSNKRPRPDDEQEEKETGKATTSDKRQRTLADMFSAKIDNKVMTASSTSKSSGNSISSLKRSASFAQPATPGLVKLNSIPFSLSAYQKSLSEQEKKLLKLECEVMGKVW
jgi:uracil-DNA glycosylase